MITVRFPLAGTFRLLRWHEQDEGHHLIVAKSHQAAVAAFQVVLREEPDAKVEEYWEAETVAPTAEMHKTYDDLVEAEELRLFEQTALSEVQYLVDRGKIKLEALPYVKLCPGSEIPNDGCSNHMYCEEFECTSGLLLNVPDKKAFLRDRQDAYNDVLGRKKTATAGTPSRATPLMPNRSAVYQAKFDPWQYGVALTLFRLALKGEECSSQYDCLFFFRKIRSLRTKEFETLTAVIEKKHADRKLTVDESVRLKQAKRDQESLARVLRALGP